MKKYVKVATQKHHKGTARFFLKYFQIISNCVKLSQCVPNLFFIIRQLYPKPWQPQFFAIPILLNGRNTPARIGQIVLAKLTIKHTSSQINHLAELEHRDKTRFVGEVRNRTVVRHN